MAYRDATGGVTWCSMGASPRASRPVSACLDEPDALVLEDLACIGADLVQSVVVDLSLTLASRRPRGDRRVDIMPLNAFIVRPFGIKEVQVASAEVNAKLAAL